MHYPRRYEDFDRDHGGQPYSDHDDEQGTRHMADHSELVSAVRSSADRLGMSPSDLLTIMSYETGSRLDHNMWGGKNNNYLGLIQMGPEERAKYNVRPGMNVTDHVTAAENFLRDRGFKPGMGLLDAYSTVNAGRPGLYNRSDANNGGAPGTVADKVASMAGHRMRANALLGLPSDATPAASGGGLPNGGAPAVAASPTPAGAAPLSLAPSASGAGQAAAPVGDDQLSAALEGLAAIPGGLSQDQGMQPAEMQAIRYFKPDARKLAAAMARMPIG